MKLLDVFLRGISRIRHLMRGRRSREKDTEVSSGYPLW